MNIRLLLAMTGALTLGLASLTGGAAQADVPSQPPRAKAGTVGLGPYQGATGYVVAPPSAFPSDIEAHLEPISKIIYLNRCRGGCTITGGSQNDARTNTSTIPSQSSTNHIAEYAFGDAEWAELLSCVQDVYSPYDVMVTDVDPGMSVLHHEAIAAGDPGDVGLSNDILGIAVVDGNCSPINNAISFTFANHHANFHRVDEVCSTIAQESAHAFGLDHVLDCSDPMTYLPYCGRKFFRNENSTCGEDVARSCRCGGLQNAHATLTAVFGAHAPSTAPPAVTLLNPQNGATVTQQFAITAKAKDVRGITHVDYYLNGFKWGTKPGVEFGSTGQPEAAYAITIPAEVPDGKIDVQVKAFNDLEIGTDSATVTVSKGADCTSAASCLDGQKCEAGKCFWDPATGELGDACTFPQACVSGNCASDGTDQICTESCFPGVEGGCPEGFECLASGAMGVCWPASGSSGGCCDTGGSTTPLTYAGLSGLVLMVLARRKRK